MKSSTRDTQIAGTAPIPCSVVTTSNGHGNLGTALCHFFRGLAAFAAAFLNQTFHQKMY
jgi:hypothetical protein